MTNLTTQPTKAPTRKLSAGASSAVIIAVVQQLAARYEPLAFLADPEIAAAVPVLIFALASYVAKERAS